MEEVRFGVIKVAPVSKSFPNPSSQINIPVPVALSVAEPFIQTVSPAVTGAEGAGVCKTVIEADDVPQCVRSDLQGTDSLRLSRAHTKPFRIAEIFAVNDFAQLIQYGDIYLIAASQFGNWQTIYDVIDFFWI